MSTPALWPGIPGYYAFPFYDPGGIKLEVVRVPGRLQTAAELAALGH